MDDAKKMVIGVAGFILAMANAMIFVYAFKLVKINIVIQPHLFNFLGYGGFFWFFVLLTLLFNATLIITVVDELRHSKK